MMSIANNGMTKVALNGYKEDAIKILQTQISMLSDIESDILSKEEQSKTDDSKSEGILTQETCKEFKQVLKGEVHKLQNFDVVLAVVGTMKAGKSTTINAIVGREILPNRNRPMTSLPTLICHNKEQKIPKLTFNSQPINDFLVDVKNAIEIYSIENPSPEIVELIQFVLQDRLFSDSYNGETDIFDFLQRLNDLVRLAATINSIADDEVLKFPYDSYQNIDALPMIDVAFKLQDDFETNGRFMLLDTAGPNESGHKELLGLLREQLKRSSAVMLVLDYTQLNSEAEESIKNEIEAIPTIQKSRLFALVNKFDQESANADDAETTKKHIFNNLLKDKIDLEHIYPISARDAYLANRMESYLLANKDKPNYKEGTWIEDFAKQVLGKRAEQKYEKMDVEDISEELGALIDDSRMSEPLTEVILNMQKNAPYIAIQSALAGASDVFEKLHNFFNIRGHFANKEKMTNEEIAELEKAILDLKTQIKSLRMKTQEIKDMFVEVTSNAKQEMQSKERERSISKNVDKVIYSIFHSESQSLEQAAKDAKKASSWYKYESSEEIRKQKAETAALAKEQAKSNRHELVFTDGKKFNKFNDNVQEIIISLNEAVVKQFAEILHESIDDTRGMTESLHEECNVILKNLKDEFKKEGIQNIKTPNLEIEITKNKDDLLKDFSVKRDVRTDKKPRPDPGLIGGTKRIFGKLLKKDWGTSLVDVTTYNINRKAMTDDLSSLIKTKTFIPLREEIESILTNYLNQNLNIIEGFNITVENVITEMNNAISQEKMPDLEKKMLYKKKIKDLQTSSQDIEEDWENLSDKFAVEKIDTQVKTNAVAA